MNVSLTKFSSTGCWSIVGENLAFSVVDKLPKSKEDVERLFTHLADATKCINISDTFAASSSVAGRSPDTAVSMLSSVHPDAPYVNLW